MSRGAITRLLNVAPDAGPLALLGLSPREATPARIERALAARLAQVDEHPEGFTPDGDEVRLALHTAAAQLLDPSAGRALLASQIAPSHESESTERAPARPVAAPMARAPLEPLDLSVPASTLPPALPEIPRPQPAPVRAFEPRGVEWASTESERRSLALPIGLAIGGVVILGGSLALIALTMRAGGPTPVVTPAAPAAPASAASAPSALVDPAPPSTSQPASVATTPLVRTPFVEASAAIRTLRQTGQQFRADAPAEARSLAAAVAPMADWWTEYDLSQRRAGIDAAVECVFALAADRAATAAALADIASWAAPLAVATPLARDPSTDTTLDQAQIVAPGSAPRARPAPIDPTLMNRAVFAAGLLARLSGEPDLPRAGASAVRDAIDQARVNAVIGQVSGFDEGARRALRALPTRLPPGASVTDPIGRAKTSVAGYMTLARAIERSDAGAESAALDAIETLLIESDEPTQNAGVHAALSELILACKWRADGPGRVRLLGWFRDTRVSLADLSVVTAVLAHRSSAEGIEPGMVVSITTGEDDRVRVRGEIARAWNLSDAESVRDAQRDLLLQVAAATSAGADGAAPIEHLARAAVASRLREAARLLWGGDADGARQILSTAQKRVDGILRTSTAPSASGAAPASGSTSAASGKLAGGGSGGSDPKSGDGSSWAESFLKAQRSIPLRLERLEALGDLGRPIGRGDAAVLVEAALLGAPSRVRAAAQQWVIRFADDPAITEALLEQLPDAPRTTPVGEMIAAVAGPAVPRVQHPNWEFIARRELVARLLSQLSSGNTDGAIDDLAGILAESYTPPEQPAGDAADPGAEQAPAEDIADRLLTGARDQFDQLSRVARALPPPADEDLSPVQCERRRAARVAVADGPIQMFAAEQLSAAELLACVVAAERPGTGPAVRSVLAEMVARRRAARHAFEQIAAGEAAMLRLWLIRQGLIEGSSTP